MSFRQVFSMPMEIVFIDHVIESHYENSNELSLAGKHCASNYDRQLII